MRQANPLIVYSALFMAFLLFWTPGYLSSAGNTTAPGYSFIGERLVYKIEWDPPWYMFFLPSLEAGEAEIHLIGETQYKNRKAIIFKKLRDAKMGVQVHYIPVHLQPYYYQLGYRKGDYPLAEDFYQREISIPLFPAMDDEDVNQVIKRIFKVFESI